MESRNDRTDELLGMCKEAIASIHNSNRWVEWLRFCASFHDYSLNNQILISLQCPDATRVAGYRKWQEMGRQVRKGEKAIEILAPCTRKRKVQTNSPDGPIEEEKRFVVGFRPVSVFDITQTDDAGGGEPPSICDIVGCKVDGYKRLLKVLIFASPCPVEFKPITGAANGYYSRQEKRIVVKVGLPQGQTLKTLAHEIGHACMHDVDDADLPDQKSREVQAESVAFVISDYLGIDSSCYTFGYLASWSSDKSAPELRASMEKIKAASAEIIGKIEAAMGVADRKTA
jgi:hypothetical protein